MKPIFKLLENLNLVLAKLNPELGTAQPQLVSVKEHFAKLRPNLTEALLRV